ncbi:MAG: glycosyltransferase [Pseudomonadota bacterium]
MRVLLAVHGFLPDCRAGTEILTLTTATRLQQRGHEVLVYAAYPGAPDLPDAQRFDSYTYESVPVARFHHAKVPMGGQRNILELEYENRLVATDFLRRLAAFAPDVVHFFHLQKLSSAVIDACDAAGVPTVFTPTDFWVVCPFFQLRLPDGSPCGGPSPLAINCVRHAAAVAAPERGGLWAARVPDALLRVLIRACRSWPFDGSRTVNQVAAVSRRPEFLRQRLNRLDRVAVPSKAMLDTLLSFGLEAHRARLVPFGVDIDAPPRQRPLRAGHLTLGFIGTLSRAKGLHVLLTAIRSTPDAPLILRVYGAPAGDSTYARQAHELAGDDSRIEFRAPFPNADIGAVLGELDALVVPSTWSENTPLVVYSAQAAGCPVLASDVPGLAEIVAHGHNGLLFAAGDSSALASCIGCLLQERGLLRRLADNRPPARTGADYVSDLLALYADLARTRPLAGPPGQ